MLSVDIDQQSSDLAQQLYRNGLSVEVGARAAVGTDHPADRELGGAAEGLLIEPLPQLARGLTQLEGRGDLGPLGSVADDLRAGPPACDQLQRFDEDRLAGAGLTGEDREPRAQFELHRIDDGEVADLQVRQHAQCSKLPRPQRSFERSSR